MRLESLGPLKENPQTPSPDSRFQATAIEVSVPIKVVIQRLNATTQGCHDRRRRSPRPLNTRVGCLGFRVCKPYTPLSRVSDKFGGFASRAKTTPLNEPPLPPALDVPARTNKDESRLKQKGR